MHKNFKLFAAPILLLAALCLFLTALTFFTNIWLFILAVIISALVFVVTAVLIAGANAKVNLTLKQMSDNILYANTEAFADTPVPTVVLYSDGEIIWYNIAGEELLFEHKDKRGSYIAELFPTLNVAESSSFLGESVELGERKYTVFVTVGQRDNRQIAVLYFVEDTSLKNTAVLYNNTRLSVAHILVDNYEELLQDLGEVERAKIMGSIEETIRNYITHYSGFLIKLGRDKFMALVEEQGVVQILEQKFALLDQVRRLELPNKTMATLSIGLGYKAQALTESNEMANQALDMCLGRGGDQAAVRTKEGYEFYGGVSTGVEKRTKVKTRIIAAALAELVEQSSNVVIMGHRFADLDAFGSAVGMMKAVRELNQHVTVCINRQQNLVGGFLQHLLEEGYTDNDFRSPEETLRLINRNTLLIIVDCHVPGVLESEAVYKACRNVVVIDHHRKLVGYISNAVIFYHEPHASSASELVTELIQYFPKSPNIGKLEAEALLAGIMLDTKNFVMRTGVRTFEAAAWLRRMGADTVEVKQLFASSMQSYRNKSHIVAAAVTYKHCALAVVPEEFEGVRIAASQAADDLMNIAEVSASFVVFPYGDQINVSARSMGAINVQVILETLGGGGHLTMAAAQFTDETLEHVEQLVREAIDNYYTSLPEETRLKMLLDEPVAPASDTSDDTDGTILEGQKLTDLKTSLVEK